MATLGTTAGPAEPTALNPDGATGPLANLDQLTEQGRPEASRLQRVGWGTSSPDTQRRPHDQSPCMQRQRRLRRLSTDRPQAYRGPTSVASPPIHTEPATPTHGPQSKRLLAQSCDLCERICLKGAHLVLELPDGSRHVFRTNTESEGCTRDLRSLLPELRHPGSGHPQRFSRSPLSTRYCR